MTKEIIRQQIEWATAQNNAFNCADKKKEKPYATKLEDNLFFGKLNEKTRKEFEDADGNELKPTPAKMCALHSSSALAVNFFDYWRNKDFAPLAKVLGITGDIKKIHFEFKSPTGAGGKSANIDVVLETATEIIAIESKFTEWFTKKENKLKEAYFTQQKKGKSLWDEKGYSEIHELAVEMRDKSPFSYLDAAQLTKHILGLSNHRDTNAKGKKITLIYLYYDCADNTKVCDTHKAEIKNFTGKFQAEGIIFKAMTYQDLFAKLKEAASSEHSAYLQYLKQRYFAQK